MSTNNATTPSSLRRAPQRATRCFVNRGARRSIRSAPRLRHHRGAACACGYSVFDVGGGLLPQGNDHGGRIFTEWWRSDQTQNFVGSSNAPASGQLRGEFS